MQIIALSIFIFVFGVVYIVVHLLFTRQRWVVKGLISVVGTIGIIGLTIHSLSPKSIAYSDPELAPLWKAVEVVDREDLGFTPVSKDSKIRIERANGRTYDVMLHIYHHTSRTIAFKKKDDSFIWIGEQEVFKGPGEHETPDGLFNERIVLTYDIEEISGYPTNILNISYAGEDSRLMSNRGLTLDDILPILEEWKY